MELNTKLKIKVNSVLRPSPFWEVMQCRLVSNYQSMLEHHRRVKTSATPWHKTKFSQIHYCHGSVFFEHCILFNVFHARALYYTKNIKHQQTHKGFLLYTAYPTIQQNTKWRHTSSSYVGWTHSHSKTPTSIKNGKQSSTSHRQTDSHCNYSAQWKHDWRDRRKRLGNPQTPTEKGSH
jgi:hypothetical protein